MASTLIRAARVVAARKNMEVINNHKHVEILSRRAKDGGLLSNVYLLPVEHRTEVSRKHAQEMVHLIKPDLLFLEIDEKRKGFLYQDDSEFAAAFKTAQQYGKMDVLLGDMSEALGDEYGWKVMDELEKTFKLKFDKKTSFVPNRSRLSNHMSTTNWLVDDGSFCICTI